MSKVKPQEIADENALTQLNQYVIESLPNMTSSAMPYLLSMFVTGGLPLLNPADVMKVVTKILTY